MNNRDVSLILIAFVIVSTFSFAVMVLPENARAATLFVGGTGPGNYTKIQDAIDVANPGDTVYVYGGWFYEDILVHTTISLVGEDRDTTIIQGTTAGDVIAVTANWSNITGFTVINSGPSEGDAGIELRSVTNCMVFNNIIWNNREGISVWQSFYNILANNTVLNNVHGIFFRSSAFNSVANNIFLDGSVGVYLDPASSNNSFLDNDISSNTLEGVYIENSDDNTISGNDVSSNGHGISLVGSRNNVLTGNAMLENGVLILGDSLEYWNTHSIDASNIINGKPVYYWKNTTGGTIPSGAGEVVLANCTDVIVKNQNVSDGTVGIATGFSSGITILNNTASSSGHTGIYVHRSHNNTIRNNTVSHSLRTGIHIELSNDNTISENVVSGNEVGIASNNSNRNSMSDNSVISNTRTGILLKSSQNSIVSRNFVSSNRFGIDVNRSMYVTLSDNTMIRDGILISRGSLQHWTTHAIDSLNTVNGKSVYYWKNTVGGTVPPGAGEVILANCTAVTVENQNLSDGTVGIELGHSTNNTISNNMANSNSLAGIYLWVSEGNTIFNNTASSNRGWGVANDCSDKNVIIGNFVSDNKDGIFHWIGGRNLIVNNTALNNQNGISLWSCPNCQIYHNVLMNNGRQAWNDQNASQWDNGYPSGGNYWSDYMGIDNCSGPNQDVCPDPDGIGDTPYDIEIYGQDRYPLMVPTNLPPPGSPTILQAELSGRNLENVTVIWSLSPDDATGLRSVVGYQIQRNVSYAPDGTGYASVAYVPNGTNEYTDGLAGDGDPNSYFYRVCAVDLLNNTTCAANQAGKFTRPLQEGPSLISVPLVQANESIGKVLQTVKFDKAWSYVAWDFENPWKWYMTFKSYKGDLKTTNHKVGIWVNVTEESNLTVAGIVPLTTSIQLHNGWNLVGFPSFCTDYTVGEFKLETGVMRVEGFDLSAPPYFLKLMKDGELFQAGYGYWVYSTLTVVWTTDNS
ncbi:MAG: right-handed parallel beta-helix repeat-containing protein [Thermoplasmata archaeon]|nr:right-handed parallel beta-helix repeat-containing protein [Thermoplasmata archaeon]